MSEKKNENLIEIKHLKEYFNINVGFLKTKPLKAVDDVHMGGHRAGGPDRGAAAG